MTDARWQDDSTYDDVYGDNPDDVGEFEKAEAEFFAALADNDEYVKCGSGYVRKGKWGEVWHNGKLVDSKPKFEIGEEESCPF